MAALSLADTRRRDRSCRLLYFGTEKTLLQRETETKMTVKLSHRFAKFAVGISGIVPEYFLHRCFPSRGDGSRMNRLNMPGVRDDIRNFAFEVDVFLLIFDHLAIMTIFGIEYSAGSEQFSAQSLVC